MIKGGRPSTLTDAQVAEIRRRYKLYHDNLPKCIAADFGISRIYVWQLANGNRGQNANPSPRPTTQEGDPKPLGEGR